MAALIQSDPAYDQAAGLRRIFARRGVQIVAVTSAPVVQGRAQLVAATAMALAARGRRLVLIDENPAPNNASNLLFQDAAANVGDLLRVVRGEVSLSQSLYMAGPNLGVVAAARLANADLPVCRRLTNVMQAMEVERDFILIDCSASRSAHLTALAHAARHLVVAVTPEGNGIMQAYSHIKRLARTHGREQFQVVITTRQNRVDARTVFNNLRQVAQEHLGVRLDYLGAVSGESSGTLADALDTCLPITPQSDENRMAHAQSSAIVGGAVGSSMSGLVDSWMVRNSVV